MADTRAVLERALEIIRDEGWCQGAFSEGPTPEEPTKAKAYCLEGAIMQAAQDNRQYTLASGAVQGVVGVLHTTAWNDAPGRTRDEVIEAFKEAIVRCPLEEGING